MVVLRNNFSADSLVPCGRKPPGETPPLQSIQFP